MMSEDDQIDLSGKILIAMPGIDDDRFTRAVILVCSHSDEHAMGIVLNRTLTDLTLPELLEQLEVPIETDPPHEPILLGGPVGKDRGFVIHSPDFESVGATIEVSNELRLTATKEILHAIASPDRPEQCRLALGYSGWGPQQLEAELKENVWLVVDADPEFVFDSDFDGKWERAFEILGVAPELLATGPVGNA